jgi:hypothetical protein
MIMAVPPTSFSTRSFIPVPRKARNVDLLAVPIPPVGGKTDMADAAFAPDGTRARPMGTKFMPAKYFHQTPNWGPNRGIYFSWLWNLSARPAAGCGLLVGGGCGVGACLGALRPRLLGRPGSAAASARDPLTGAEAKPIEVPTKRNACGAIWTTPPPSPLVLSPE